MVRALITIEDEKIKKLDSLARKSKKSRAQLVREAVDQYLVQNAQQLTWKEILQRTAGIWKDRKIDSVEYVRKLRAEWDRDLK